MKEIIIIIGKDIQGIIHIEEEILIQKVIQEENILLNIIAMVGGFPVVWIVSLFTKKLPKNVVETIFECYK